MSKNRLLCLIFFLFFILLINNANAYQEFSYNSKFNTDSTGILIYSPDSNSTLSWNASYLGASDGVAILTTNDTGSDIRIFMQEFTHAEQQVTQNLTLWTEYQEYNANIAMPPYKDTFVSVSYLSNETLGAYSGFSYPMLYILSCTDLETCTVINSTALVTTADQFNNISLYIPYLESTRVFRIQLSFSLPASTDFVLDKFKFYTYDIDEARTSYFTTVGEEQINYCGDDTFSTNLWAKTNSSLKLAFMILNNNDDNKLCCMFQNGNQTLARRCEVYNTGSCTNTCTEWTMRDMVFLLGNPINSGTRTFMLIKNLNTNSIKYSIYQGQNCSSPATQGNYLVFNGDGNITWTYMSSYPCKRLDQVDAVMDISNYNLSGTKFANYWNPASFHHQNTYISFPNYVTRCDNVGWFCSNADDEEYYVSSTCIPSTPTSCKGCGCSGDRCNIPAFPAGTYCDENDTSEKGYYTYLNISTCDYGVSYGECGYNEVCVPLSSGKIECFNSETGSTGICINSTGGNFTCPPSNLCLINYHWIDCPSLSQNPLGSFALLIGSLVGTRDLVVAENFTSFIFSIILGFAAIITVAVLSKRNVDTHGLTSVGLGFGTFSLLMFSFLPDKTTGETWFPTWLSLLILTFTAILLAGGFSKIVGGEK